MVSSWEIDAMNRQADAQRSRAEAEWARVQATREQTKELRALRKTLVQLLAVLGPAEWKDGEPPQEENA